MKKHRKTNSRKQETDRIEKARERETEREREIMKRRNEINEFQEQGDR